MSRKDQESRSPIHSQPKVLIVDDEEAILSASRRLLRGTTFEILTTNDPQDALSIIEREDCWVVVSDYRMPNLNGVQFLEIVKERFPYVTRMILTGYLETPVLEEAINRAGVFRFLTKPWSGPEFLQSIEAAIQHSERRRTRSRLVQEIGAQNLKLERLSENLETEVKARTEGIELSSRLAASKQKRVRDLTVFVKDLSTAADFERLLKVLNQGLARSPGILSMYFLVHESFQGGRLFGRDYEAYFEKSVSQIPEELRVLRLRGAGQDEKRWLSKLLGREIRELYLLPIRSREQNSTKASGVLLIEHNLSPENLSLYIDNHTDRIQPISIVVDRILLGNQLEQASRTWETTFNAFNDPIGVVEHDGTIVRANKAFSKFKGKKCHKSFDNNSKFCSGCMMPLAFESNHPSEGLVRTKRGTTWRQHCYPVRQASGDQLDRVVSHYLDISEERDLFMKLVQSEKLAAVGLLAGNIAHELNNPLSGIRALAQLIQTEIDKSDTRWGDLHEVELAAQRCQDIIKDLLYFSQSPSQQLIMVSLNDIVKKTIPMLKTSMRSHNLHLHLSENVPPTMLAAGLIQQVLFNLINNACQAMPEGGRLTIESGRKRKKLWVSISDTGKGIPVEIQSKIFEPFFTTKKAGVGTGLGLSVSRSIIEKLGGELTFESKPGEGTTFRVEFPISQAGDQ